jgi:hypothetical protein
MELVLKYAEILPDAAHRRFHFDEASAVGSSQNHPKMSLDALIGTNC